MTSFRDSLWSATAPPAPNCPPLAGTTDTDTVVVGAGYTGLSCALHLARTGHSVVVLEAEEPGFGCSGRNGGQVNPGSTRMAPSEVLSILGPERGERFLAFGHRSTDIVFDLVERYGIECEALRPGYVQGAYGKRGLDMCETWVREWGERGVDVTMLDAGGIRDLIGAQRYDGGLVDGRGGNIQPLAFARGLADAAIGEGAAVHGGSAVTGIQRNGQGWRVSTDAGHVNCAHVVLATNGYTDDLWPGLRQSIVPTTSFVTATKPLGHNHLAGILPGRHAVSETARILVYYRLDAAGRFIIGGHGNLFDGREFGDNRHVQAEAARLFPELADVEWEYHWAGWPAITPDHLPKLFRLDEGVFAGLGYNGRGVGSATLMGQQLAQVVSGEGEPLIEVTPLKRFALHRFRQAGISFHLLSRGFLDGLDKTSLDKTG